MANKRSIAGISMGTLASAYGGHAYLTRATMAEWRLDWQRREAEAIKMTKNDEHILNEKYTKMFDI